MASVELATVGDLHSTFTTGFDWLRDIQGRPKLLGHQVVTAERTVSATAAEIRRFVTPEVADRLRLTGDAVLRLTSQRVLSAMTTGPRPHDGDSVFFEISASDEPLADAVAYTINAANADRDTSGHVHVGDAESVPIESLDCAALGTVAGALRDNWPLILAERAEQARVNLLLAA